MIHNEAVLCNSKFNAGNLSSDGGAVLMNKFLEDAHYFDLLKSISFRENDIPTFIKSKLSIMN